MENEFNKIDDLFRDSFSDYSETPPPTVWPVLEKRLGERKKRRAFPLLRWYWLGAMLAFISLLGAILMVDMKAKAPAMAEKAVLPPSTATGMCATASGAQSLPNNGADVETNSKASEKMENIDGGTTRRSSKKSPSANRRAEERAEIAERQTGNMLPVAVAELPTSKNAPAVGTSVYSYDDFEDETGNVGSRNAEAGENTYAESAGSKHKIVVAEVMQDVTTAIPEEADERPKATVATTRHKAIREVEARPQESVQATKSGANVKYSSATYVRHMKAKAEPVLKGIETEGNSASATAKVTAQTSMFPDRYKDTKAFAKGRPAPKPEKVQQQRLAGDKGTTAAIVKFEGVRPSRTIAATPARSSERTSKQHGRPAAKEPDHIRSTTKRAESATATKQGRDLQKNETAEQATEIAASKSGAPAKSLNRQLQMPKNAGKHTKQELAKHHNDTGSDKVVVKSAVVVRKTGAQEAMRVNEGIAALPIHMPYGAHLSAVSHKLTALSKLPATTKSASAGEPIEGRGLSVPGQTVSAARSAIKQEVGVKAEKKSASERVSEKQAAVGKPLAGPQSGETPQATRVSVGASVAKPDIAAKPAVNANVKLPSVIAGATGKYEKIAADKEVADTQTPTAIVPKAAGTRKNPDSVVSFVSEKKTANQRPDSAAAGITPFMRFVYGIKGGLESGLSVAAGNKLLVAPYIRYNFNDRFGLQFQPAIKLGNLASHAVGNPVAYHDIKSGTGNYELTGTSMVYLVLTGDTLVRRDYAYTEKYDSIIKQNQVGGTYAEMELPLLLHYQLTSRLAIYGGVNTVLGKRFSVEEKTRTFANVTATGEAYSLNRVNEPATLPSFTGVSYTSSPISSYSGATYSTNAGSIFRMGYMLGVSYEWKKRWAVDAAVQQCFMQKNIQGGYNVNRVLSAPYFRLTVGYRLKK